jgi:spore photoproduct lyase
LGLQPVRFTEPRGNVVRDCPGTLHHVCCGYKTIDLVEGCLLGCSYCILRTYLNTPGVRVVSDATTVLEQVDRAIEAESRHILRFGTGELSDSLALDRRLRINGTLVEHFGRRGRALLELKSKWASIDHLVPVLNPYTVISFSLTPPRIIADEEQRTSPLHKRLKTLRKAQAAGCFVGLHFDPVIIYEGFEKDYAYVIEDVARILDLERVIWVSLGLLRFPPSLYNLLMEERRRNLLHGEFIRGEDGKYRYIKSERIRVYRMIYDLLKSKNENLFVYLCMERSDLWKAVTGMDVADTEALTGLFDARIGKFFGGTL